MYLILRERIHTPIITKQPKFHAMGCQFRIHNPRKRHISKINTGRPMYPYGLIGYLGDLEVSYPCNTCAQAQRKLDKLLTVRQLGRLHAEGFGRVAWLEGELCTKPQRTLEPGTTPITVRIRKGLPHDLPADVQRLLRYALLHDFVHTEQHASKIYLEPELPDREYLKQHHDRTDDPLIQTFQQYDRRAAIMTRKVRSPRTDRYTWKSQGYLDFDQLVQEIEEVHDHIWKLYNYIYNSKELEQLSESLEYGHSSLRFHLLVIANSIVRDYQRKRLCLFKGKS